MTKLKEGWFVVYGSYLDPGIESDNSDVSEIHFLQGLKV